MAVFEEKTAKAKLKANEKASNATAKKVPEDLTQPLIYKAEPVKKVSTAKKPAVTIKVPAISVVKK